MSLDILKQVERLAAGSSSPLYTDSVKASRGTTSSPAVVQNDDVIWRQNFYAHDGTNYVLAGYLQVVVDDTPATNDMPGKMQLFLSPDGSATPVLVWQLDMLGAMQVGLPSALTSAALSGQILAVVDGATGAASLLLERYRDASNIGVIQVNASRGSRTARSIVQANDNLAILRGSGFDGSAFRSAGEIVIFVDGTPGASDMPGGIGFYVTPDGSTAVALAGRFRQNKNFETLNGITNAGAHVNTPVALTDAATIATDASLGNTFTVTLGGNRTMGAPTNPVNGQRILYRIRQDGTGSRTLGWNAAFRFSTTRPSPTLTTTINRTDYIEFIYNSTDSKWDVINIDLNHN